MFLDKLVSLGKPFLVYGMDPVDTLKQVTDVSTDGRFLQNVVIVEVARKDGRIQSASLPLMTWGRFDEAGGDGKRTRGKPKKVGFNPDVAHGLALPYALAAGGNPTVPQGNYGVAVYPAYPNNIKKMAGTDETCRFLGKRIERTLNLPVLLTKSELDVIAGQISSLVENIQAKVDSKDSEGYALVALVFPGETGPYHYIERMPIIGDRESILVGESVLFPGTFIVAETAELERTFWDSKMAEGMAMGHREICSICDKEEDAVSPYSKTWNWLSYTWDAPIAERFRGNDPDLAGAIGALCRSCYSSLIMGAGIFSEVSAPLPYYLTKEIFAPVASAGGRDAAKKSKSDIPKIDGCALILPFNEKTSIIDREEMLAALSVFRSKNQRKGKNDLALAAITGFEAVLPEELETDDYRLTIVYYQESNADVQLRAVIEDVLPSTITALADYVPHVADEAAEIRRKIAVTETDFSGDYYRSLVYLLIRAFGGGYLWHTIRSILNKQPINRRRFVQGSALRMGGYGGMPGESSFWGLREEVAFYLAFHKFLNFYYSQILKEGYIMPDWRQTLDKVSKTPPERLGFESVEELGFAAGYLTSRFGRQYYRITGGNKEKKTEGKDFLKHRVMAFGSKLNPEMVWRKALSRFQEYAVNLDIKLSEDFRCRTGVVESEFRRLRQQVEKNRDEFMGAFWSGYALAREAGKAED